MYLGAILPLPLREEAEELLLEEDDSPTLMLALLATLPMEEEIRPSGGRDRFGSGNRTLFAVAAAAWAVIAA